MPFDKSVAKLMLTMETIEIGCYLQTLDEARKEFDWKWHCCTHRLALCYMADCVGTAFLLTQF